MSYSALRRRNRGSYSNPFSGVGLEFAPLGPLPADTGILLHEAGYLARNDWWMFPNTLSPFWRLYYNFDSGHQVVFPHGACPLGPGALVLIPDHQLFHSAGTHPVRHFWLTFSVGRRVDLPERDLPLRLSPSKVELGLIQGLARLFHGIGCGDRERIFHQSLALLHLVLSRPEIRWQPGQVSDSVQRALRLMETDYARALGVSDLARAAGLSVRGFAKAFKQQQGVTPARFLNRVRVREVSGLLANTGRSLDDIAAQTGFPNRFYLSRVFKQVTGNSPARFRRTHGTGVAGWSPGAEALSAREMEVLGHLARGALYKEIAQALGLAYGTVHTHIERIYAKLGVRSRAQAVARYFRA